MKHIVNDRYRKNQYRPFLPILSAEIEVKMHPIMPRILYRLLSNSNSNPNSAFMYMYNCEISILQNFLVKRFFNCTNLIKILNKIPFFRENTPFLTTDNIGGVADPIGQYYRPFLPILSADILVSVVHILNQMKIDV